MEAELRRLLAARPASDKRARVAEVKTDGCRHCKSESNPRGETTIRKATVTPLSGGSKCLVEGTCANTGKKTRVFKKL